MTIVANKHVACVGHEFAAAMTADTPIIEIAKMVSRLATALDKQTELTEQLAMENTILLTPENWLKHSEEGAAASAIAEGNGASEDEALLAGMKSIIACMQSLATSAAIAALREEATEAAFNSDKHAALCDSAYVSGMQAGWNFGVDEDVTGFQQSLEAYRKPMREARRHFRESKVEVQS